MRHRHALQQDLINQRKDCGVCADSQSKRSHGYNREERISSEQPCAIANVLPEGFNQVERAHLAASLLCKSWVAEMAPRVDCRLAAALRAIFFFTHGEVKLHFVFQVAIKAAPAQQRFESKPKFVKHHRPPMPVRARARSRL